MTGLFFFSTPALFAYGEIKIEGVTVENQSPSRYVLSGSVTNASEETREVVLRGQIVFYERGTPEGDLPIAVLRKDITQVLTPWETRGLKILLLNEGAVPKTALRTKPVLRIRRQRVWNY